MARADMGPLPGGTYPSGTMAIADLYPAHKGIGGIGTQDLALPAFAERQISLAENTVGLGAPMESALIGQPAGWVVLALLAILVATYVVK